MTEPLLHEARPETSNPYGGRLFLTLFLVALYLAGHVIGLPWVHWENLSAEAPRQTLLILGFAPLITGFLLAELFSLLTPPGRLLRKSGTAGRRRLNRAALILSLLCAAVQGLGIALLLEGLDAPLAPVVDRPGWLFRLLLIATLTAVTAVIVLIANALSEFGIGNGFALLSLAEIGWSGWWNGAAVRAELSEDSLPPAVGIFVAAGLVVLLVRFIRSTEATWTPPFPQGILPVQGSLAILGFPWVLGLLGDRFLFGNFDLVFLVGTLVAIPLLSWLTFGLFSSRPRLEADLPATPEVVDRVEDVLERRLNPSAAFLALGTTALFAWNAWQPHSLLTTSFTFLELILIVIIALDLLDQYWFTQRHGQMARLVQLDNVHLSYLLAERLQEKGIDCLARAQRLRSLLFFLGALIKIDVYVPTAQLDRGREVWMEMESAGPIVV
jgi:hypothetical protein